MSAASPERIAFWTSNAIPIPATSTNVAANRVVRIPESGLKIRSANEGYGG